MGRSATMDLHAVTDKSSGTSGGGGSGHCSRSAARSAVARKDERMRVKTGIELAFATDEGGCTQDLGGGGGRD